MKEPTLVRDGYYAVMEQTMSDRVHFMPVDQVEIVCAELGDNAGVIGAALWTSENYIRSIN